MEYLKEVEINFNEETRNLSFKTPNGDLNLELSIDNAIKFSDLITEIITGESFVLRRKVNHNPGEQWEFYMEKYFNRPEYCKK